MAGEGAPDIAYLAHDVPAAATGADVSDLNVAPFAGTLVAADIFPLTAITGADTNSRTINVFNRGQAGAGTALMATKAFVTGVGALIETDTPIVLSATPANLVVAAGDVIEVQSLHVGTGLACPQSLVRLQIARVSGS